MSHDDNAKGLTASPAPRTRHTSSPGRLERPSLFFGMEDEQVDEVDTDRVRLLPSEGRGRGKAGARQRTRGHAASASSWWASPGWGRALVALMGLGAMAVLYSFVQVVSQPHAMSAQARAQAKAQAQTHAQAQAAVALDALPPTAAGPGSVTAAAVSVGSTASHPAPAPARIETSAVVPSATAIAAEPAPRQAASAALSSAGPEARHVVARAAADAVRLNAPAAAPPRPAGTSSDVAPRPRANEDVALLEAMMRHASARKAPPSASEALQGCTRLQGPEAAVCKAKACVQHPTALQCHSDVP